MRFELICPPLPPQEVDRLNDFKACDLSRRPAFLKIAGGRLSEEGFLKEVRVDDHGSLYKGPWSLVKATLNLVKKGKIRVMPLAGTETDVPKPPTEKQRSLILQLCRELGETHPIPSTRRDASLLIQALISRKRAMKKTKGVAA